MQVDHPLQLGYSDAIEDLEVLEHVGRTRVIRHGMGILYYIH